MHDLKQYHHSDQASLRPPDQAPLRHPDQAPFVIPTNRPFVILNSFQDNEIPLPVILKRVQDDEVV